MTPEQKVKAATRVELEKLLAADNDHKAQLSFEELTTVCSFTHIEKLSKSCAILPVFVFFR